MKFRYKLSKGEIADAILCIEWKTQKKFHGKHLWITSILGAGVLIEYIHDPEKFYLAFVLGVIIVMLLYLVYTPIIRRKRKIKKLVKLDGEYQLEIHQDYIVGGNRSQKISLREKEIRVVYTENVYVLRIGEECYAVPRRLMNEEQKKKFEEILKKHHGEFTKLIVENGRSGERV